MAGVLAVTLPVFALVFCGYFAQRFRMLPENAVDGINAFVFHFALPAMLFRIVSTQPASRFAEPRFALGYMLSTSLVFVAVRAIALRGPCERTPAGRSHAVGFAMTASMGNAGYLGVPLALELGARYVPTMVLSIVCDIAAIITTSIALLEIERRRANPAARGANPALAVLSSVAKSPLVLSIGAGFLVTLSDLRLPVPFAGFVRILSGAAGPCALFAIGASLGNRRIAFTKTVRALVATKLVAHPALAAAILAWVMRADPIAVAVGVLAASLPSAGNAFIIAQRYGVDMREISSAILLGTFVALATVSFAIWATGLR